MLSKISVKKPYTVLVGVVLILVLGFMSFRNMSTDLLPSMEMPYAIVMTTYPGASPEEVESAVTKPVEQAMASISNMKEVSSMSNSNVSVVMLEFNEGADMDTATIDMRESLDAVAASWSDSIGSPTIMKINPDMMPILIAAVDCEGLDEFELADKLDADILPDIESVEGVASVSVSGNVEKKVDVIIQQDKLDVVNKKIQNAIDGKFDDAKDEIKENQDKIADGKEELSNQQESTAQGLADGQAEIDKNAQEMASALATINTNLASLTEKEATLAESEKSLKQGLAQIATSKVELQSTIKQLNTAKESLTKLKSGLEELNKQKTNIEGQIATYGETTELKTALEAINTQLVAINAQLVAQGMDEASLVAKLAEVESGLAQANAGLTEIATKEKELKASQKELEAGKKQLAAGKTELENAKAKIEAGQIGLAEAQKELSKQSILAAIKLSVAEMEVNNGQTQLDQAETTLEDTEESTKDSMDAESIITKSMVENVLYAENFEMPAGYITEGNASYLVKVGEKFDSIQSMEDLVICDFGLDGLNPIYLSDVADIVVTDNSQEQYTVVNGNPAIALTIEKATGYSTGDVTDRLLERFEELKAEVEGLRISVLMDQGVYIDMVVDSVVENLILGGLFAIVILFLFLRDIRPTIIVACSIPLSVVAAIVLMYFSNVTLNVISLSGLALGVGMLVDNSVVVIENIFRMRNEEGASIKRAAIEGASQVAGAILASTLTTVCVFAPIVFTEGMTKQLFVDLALTLAYSLLASLVVSLTLVPAMAKGILRKEKEQKEGLVGKLQNAYVVSLQVLIKKKALVLITSLVLLVVFVALAFSRGTTFMPAMQSTQMTATISVPEDKEGMSDEELYAEADKAVERFAKIEGIDVVGAMSGGSGTMSMMSGGSGSDISVYILLDEENTRSNAEIRDEMLAKVEGLNCEVSVEESAMDMTALMGSGISINVKGKDLDKLQKITEEMISQVEGVEGVDTVSNGMEDGEQEFRIAVDKDKAMKYSLTVAQVFQQINGKLADATSATTLSTDTDELDVYVSDAKNEAIDKKALKDLKLDYTDSETQKTKTVKLSKIADFQMAKSPTSINRSNQTRYMTVSITVKNGYNVGLVSNDVNEALEDYELPAGYTLESTGEDEATNDAMGQVVLLLVVGVLFMYLIMVAQFQSLLSPFIILFTIPLAFTGGFMGLWISGSEVSIIAMIGFVMLSGIIVNNGIVLVDYINQLRASGVEKYEAIVQAGRIRLRPILMTALTTILGLLPMLLTNDSGSDMMKPMSIVTVGGMVYGTLLTLFVVPCIYAILNRKSDEKFMEDQLDD